MITIRNWKFEKFEVALSMTWLRCLVVYSVQNHSSIFFRHPEFFSNVEFEKTPSMQFESGTATKMPVVTTCSTSALQALDVVIGDGQ